MSDLPEILYHYTSYHGLDGILNSKQLWCSKIQYMNDSEELRHGMQILADACQEYDSHYFRNGPVEKATREKFNSKVFVTSFCENKDLLSQWRGYSSSGGVSIGFESNQLVSRIEDFKTKFMGTNCHLVKCVYDEDEQRRITLDFLNTAINFEDFRGDSSDMIDMVTQKFIPTASRFKHPSFIEEDEWRLIIVSPPHKFSSPIRVAGNKLIPYEEFDLSSGYYPFGAGKYYHQKCEDIGIREVMVGPHPHQSLQHDALDNLQIERGSLIGRTAMSSTPYRQL